MPNSPERLPDRPYSTLETLGELSRAINTQAAEVADLCADLNGAANRMEAAVRALDARIARLEAVAGPPAPAGEPDPVPERQFRTLGGALRRNLAQAVLGGFLSLAALLVTIYLFSRVGA